MVNPKTAAKQWLRKTKAKFLKVPANKINIVGNVGTWKNVRTIFFKGKSPYYHAGKNADNRIERERLQKQNFENNRVVFN